MAPVNICLIGHRGAGKTTYLDGVTRRRPGRVGFDLDREIARDAGHALEDIFAREGEAGFRARERTTLARLLARPEPKIIALGAGFDGPRPDARMVWIRRATDQAGRVFSNRPRLDPAVEPLTEYLDRFPERERRYREWADFTLALPEGYDGGLEDALDFEWTLPYDFTLPPHAGPDFLELRASWNLRRLEVRDDLSAAEPTPAPPHLLRSYRRGPPRPPDGTEEDWALELGPPPRAFAITSVHAGDVTEAARRLRPFADRSILKMAVEVRGFDELLAGHRWWAEDPGRRAFLPRDPVGRWRWYRSLFGPRMPIHFVREDDGSALDQPLLWQTRLQPACEGTFAAVLGHPVEHSRTPLEHRAFFAERLKPVVAVDVRADEWTVALQVLRELGLTHAAVTAPLKEFAFELATDRAPDCQSTGAANTLYFAGDRVWATNTDVIALRALSRELTTVGPTWLWGGGGVKSSVRAAWPGTREVSARVGVDASELDSPGLLIWAVGRSRAHRTPPAHLRPGLVLDLNYADDSPGLEYAVTRGLPYQSGLAMFKLQAEAQREFWTAREDSRAGKSIR